MKTPMFMLMIAMLAAAGPASAAAPKPVPTPIPVAPAGKSEKTDLAKALGDKLTDAEGKPVDAAKHLGKAKYTLVYFSAGWCGPCHKFTPTLVKFVEENQKGGNLAVVMVSWDKAKPEMLAYMKEKKMPWPAVLGSEVKLGAAQDGVSSIPRMRVFDAEGRLIMESKQMGRPELLAALKAKLDAEKPAK